MQMLFSFFLFSVVGGVFFFFFSEHCLNTKDRIVDLEYLHPNPVLAIQSRLTLSADPWKTDPSSNVQNQT